MINLYGKTNTNYTKNGDATLIPIRADLSITLNGSWSLEIEVPYDREGRWELIEEGAVIQVDVNCIRELSGARQCFRIYDYKKGISSVTAIAFPVAMESTHDAPIDNLILSGLTGVQAMAQIQTKTNKYTLYSDITRTGSTSFANTNVNNAIASGDDGCFIDVWGGEIVYDNLKFSVLNRVGNSEQNKHKIIYGKNITGISYERDDSGLITRIYPISQDSIRLNGSGYVDSSKASQYPIIHSRFMTAPYRLIEDNISSSTATAQLTRSIKSQITTLTSSLSHSIYDTAVSQKVEIDYIRSLRNEIVSAVQSVATANIYQADANKVMQAAIKDGMEWLKDVEKAEWTWHGSDASGWWYGSSTSDRATSEYVYVDRIWRYFGDNSLWQKPRDDASKKWGWVQESSGKKYGNSDKYYAQKTNVYITMNGQMKEYYFDDDGIWDESDDTDSDYAWHGSGSSSDPYWFGDDSTTGKYLKDGWWFIDGVYYYFDSEGYWDNTTKFDDYRWDWVETADGKYWFGNPDKTFARTLVSNQWLKVDGDWYRFDSNGYAIGDTTLENEVVNRFKNGVGQLKTLCESLYTQAYNLLYSQMSSYCTKMFNTGIDVPSVTITVDMADLSNTTEYAKYQHLEKVYLGDSVTAIDYKHRISAVERVVGITFDCIRKKNATVVIGVASASLSNILKTDAGGSVAGGFDTSAIENALTSHGNSIASLQANKQDKLTAGENISIVNNVISATGGGGGVDVLYGQTAPNNSIGNDKDFYLRFGQTTYGSISDQSYEVTTVSLDSFAFADNKYNLEMSGTPRGGWDTILFQIAGLEEDSDYVVSFDIQFGEGTTFAHGTYGNWSQVFYSSSPSGSYDIDPERTDAVVEEHNLNLQHCSYVFTAGETNYLAFGFQNCTDGRVFSVTVSNLTISNGEASDRIKAIYNKHEGEWLKYEDDSLIASEIYYDNTTSGLNAVNVQGAIDEVSENIIGIEANPSGTATTTLNKIEIDGVIYDLPSGGGGGGGGFDATTLYEATSYSNNITLDDDYTNYDYLLFTGYATAGTGYLQSNLYKVEDLLVNNNIGIADDGNYSWWKITSETTLVNSGSIGTYYVKKIYGLKASSGGSGGSGGGAVTLYKATDTTHHNIQLSDSWTNYETLLVTMCTPNPTADASTSFTVNVASIVDGFIIGQGAFGYNWHRLFPSNATDVIEYWIDSGSSYYIDSVVGIKPASGSGGSSELGLKYDFTKTPLDVLSLTPITLENVTRTANGLVFNSSNGYAYLSGSLLCKNMVYEIEVVSLNISDTSRHNDLFRYQNVGSSQNAGLIYRYQTLKWAVWDSTNGWQDSDISDKDYFNNSVVKVKILDDGKWEIYKDDVLVFAPPLAMVFEGTDSFGLGSPNASATSMTIKSFRAYVDGYKDSSGGGGCVSDLPLTVENGKLCIIWQREVTS